MARAVARLGHEVAIYTTDRELRSDKRPPTGAIERREGVELRVFRQQFPAAFATSWPLARALADAVPRADVVHIHSLYLFHDWAAARLCRRHGVPYLLRPHGTLDPFHWKRHRWRKRVAEILFQNRVLREAAALHFTAEEEMRLAQPYAQGAPGVVVANGVELGDYAELPPVGRFRAAHPGIGARRIVLFLGRLNYKKGLNLLVPAFAEVLKQHHDLHLVIAGPDDGMEKPARELVVRTGISAHVSFVGLLQGEDKLAAFRDAYVFALPSYSENFAIAAAEAMACGVPVLLSDKVNIWRDVEQWGAGLTASTEVASVAEILRVFVANPAATAAMGEKGRGLVAAKFSWERIGRELEDVYRRLAEDRVPAS